MEPITMFLVAVATSAGKAGGSAAGKAVGQEIGRGVATTLGLSSGGVLESLLDMQAQQQRMLARVDAKLDVLLTGPMRTGLRQVEEAMSPRRTAEDRDSLLRDARRSFFEAVGQDPSALRRSFSELHLAGVWIALDSPDDVPPTLENAYREALRAVAAVDDEAMAKASAERAVRGSVRGRRNRAAADPVDHDVLLWDTARYARRVATTCQAWGVPLMLNPAEVDEALDAMDDLQREAERLEDAGHEEASALWDEAWKPRPEAFAVAAAMANQRLDGAVPTPITPAAVQSTWAHEADLTETCFYRIQPWEAYTRRGRRSHRDR